MIDQNTEVYFGVADRPIFIGGLMKSGTSLLRVLLGQHPELYGGFETHWFDQEIRFNWQTRNSRRMMFLLKFFDLSQAELDYFDEIKKNEPTREFIDIVMERCTQRAGKNRWVEKTPGNIQHFSLICKEWKHARFIHVKREYRDCFASWKSWRGDDLATFLYAAKTAYYDVASVLGRHTDQYMEVDYEQLVNRPISVMREVLRFCELEWAEECSFLDLDRTSQERQKVKVITGRDSHTNISLSKPIFTGQIGQWKKLLTIDEAHTIRHELSNYYEILGRDWCD